MNSKISGLATIIRQDLIDNNQSELVDTITQKTAERLSGKAHGDFSRWFSSIDAAPSMDNVVLSVDQSAIGLSSASGEPELQSMIEDQLKALMPWRKGPYQVFNTYVDAEWRSDFKWQRMCERLDLADKKILDIGCGNGYHCWRMLEQKPKWVLGVDPNVLFNLQFRYVNHYAQRNDIDVVPLGIEHLPSSMHFFDVVFSMGVFYHRKSPIEHLMSLKSLLVKGGELILETLVVEGGKQEVLVPEGRYAQMNNVWFIPSVLALQEWLKKVGFTQVKTINVTATTVEEQRGTEWMVFDSLDAFLDPVDSGLTIEGYPAPLRAIISARY